MSVENKDSSELDQKSLLINSSQIFGFKHLRNKDKTSSQQELQEAFSYSSTEHFRLMIQALEEELEQNQKQLQVFESFVTSFLNQSTGRLAEMKEILNQQKELLSREENKSI